MIKNSQGSKATTKKAHKKPLFIAVSIVAVIVLGFFGYYFINQRDKNQLDCQTALENLDGQIIQKDYQAANQSIATFPSGCDSEELADRKPVITAALKSQDKVSPIIAEAQLAIEAYKTGKTDQAKTQADKTISLVKNLADEDKQQLSPEKVTQLNNYLEDMYAIQGGYYNPNRKPATP